MYEVGESAERGGYRHYVLLFVSCRVGLGFTDVQVRCFLCVIDGQVCKTLFVRVFTSVHRCDALSRAESVMSQTRRQDGIEVCTPLESALKTGLLCDATFNVDQRLEIGDFIEAI